MMKIKKFFKKLSTFNFQLSTPKGFTLIELLVVVAIIGILVTTILVIINPGDQLKKSRDTQRKRDLTQIQTALDAYHTDKNHYPDANIQQEIAVAPWGSEWYPYMTKVPQDPLSTQGYYYKVANDRSWYRLYTRLENCLDAQRIPESNCADYNYSVTSSNIIAVTFGATPIPPSSPTPAPPTNTPGPATPTPNPTSTPNPTPTIIPGLIAKWSFNDPEAPGQDTSGNGNHGTVNGATWQNASTCGSGSGCLSFDGVDDYITLGNNNIFNETGSGSTTLFRLRPLSLGGPAGYMMIIRFKATTEFLISIGATGNPQQGGTSVYFGFRGQTAITNNTDAYLNNFQNTWKKFAVTYNGGPKGNTSSYNGYVDGNPITLLNPFTVGGDATNANEIGKNIPSDPNPGWINGYLDEVRLYNRALTQAEIQNL